MRRTTLTLSTLVAIMLLALAAPAARAVTPAAVTPAIVGYYWVDTNCNGLRDDGEPSITNIDLYLFRFGPDGIPFTSDDGLGSTLFLYITGPRAGQYEHPYAAARMPAEQYRLSILQGARPAGYVPTKYRQGNDPSRWSSLEQNWTTTGFQLDPNGTVSGGNVGIAPASCIQQWYPNHLYVPMVSR